VNAAMQDHQGVTVSLSEHAADSLSVTNNEPGLSIRARAAAVDMNIQRESRTKSEGRAPVRAACFEVRLRLLGVD
jgi:hypothetical protein